MSRAGKCAECGKELTYCDRKKMRDYQETNCCGDPKTFYLCDDCYDYLLEEQYIE